MKFGRWRAGGRWRARGGRWRARGGRAGRSGQRDERAGLSTLAGTALLEAFAAAYPGAVFVEIGSNDGETHDHLRPFVTTHDWRGVMVEPVPAIFERLRAAYAGSARVTFENAAIAASDGRATLYHVAEPDQSERDRLPYWFDALGSLRREVVMRHRDQIPDLESRIVAVDVPTITFETLCARHAIECLDLLAVDTEGYDYEILRSIDFQRMRPRLVLYEHYHLSDTDRAACIAHMRARGYETMEEGFDSWCLDVSLDDELTRLWRGLAPTVPGVSHDG